MAGRTISRCRIGSLMDHGQIRTEDIAAALSLAVGDPELVIVDARVLRLLMPGLSSLIILGPAPGEMRSFAHPFDDEEDVYVWDRRSPCD